MPHANIWIRKEDFEKWQLIDNKAELISQAINRSIIQVVKKSNGTLKTKQEVINPEPALLNIPGIEKASEAKCKGTHYMNRVDCGKVGCPWKAPRA